MNSGLMKSNVIHFCLLALVVPFISAQNTPAQNGSATLYSPNRYRNEKRDFCLDFKAGVSQRNLDPCDLRYGTLYAGDDWDWFQSSTARSSRSVIKDLGQLAWNDQIKVPVVTPFPKLAAGEERKFTVDTSGADGADGAPGAEGAPGLNADGTITVRPTAPTPRPVNKPEKKKNDGIPKIDPVFVKAIVGHMYVIHVVDHVNDFYALFRVEAIERGDYCRVSWKFIDPPKDTTPDN